MILSNYINKLKSFSSLIYVKPSILRILMLLCTIATTSILIISITTNNKLNLINTKNKIKSDNCNDIADLHSLVVNNILLIDNIITNHYLLKNDNNKLILDYNKNTKLLINNWTDLPIEKNILQSYLDKNGKIDLLSSADSHINNLHYISEITNNNDLNIMLKLKQQLLDFECSLRTILKITEALDDEYLNNYYIAFEHTLKYSNNIIALLIPINIIIIIIFLLIELSKKRVISITNNMLKKQEDANSSIIMANFKFIDSERSRHLFSEVIIHELRSPMQTLTSICDILNSIEINPNPHLNNNSNLEGSINKINLSSKLINNSVEKLRTQLINLQEQSMTTNNNSLLIRYSKFDITEMFSELIEKFTTLCADKNINFVCNSNLPDSKIIVGDKVRCIQIFDNIFENALKYTNAGSININICLINEDLNVLIKDTGIGISEDFSSLLKPFTRGSNIGEVKGTGIGLSVVSSLVKLLNGSIDGFTNSNNGLTVCVKLKFKLIENENDKTLIVYNKSIVDLKHLKDSINDIGVTKINLLTTDEFTFDFMSQNDQYKFVLLATDDIAEFDKLIDIKNKLTEQFGDNSPCFILITDNIVAHSNEYSQKIKHILSSKINRGNLSRIHDNYLSGCAACKGDNNNCKKVKFREDEYIEKLSYYGDKVHIF